MVAGDVVNTAARLQSGGAGERDPRRRDDVPGDARRRSTYREAEPVTAKGKAEPVAVWEALEARSRVGVDVVAGRAPLVGRRRELELLAGRARSRARASARPSS